ncbi:LppU/SCO3897 family protein [Streptomyces angustmyceticus]|uniref:LppU/SCO3897 family protein n=1 Tax=Streptomyces angustmyceticus TaxID=285578 RepID=UPI00344E3A4E
MATPPPPHGPYPHAHPPAGPYPAGPYAQQPAGAAPHQPPGAHPYPPASPYAPPPGYPAPAQHPYPYAQQHPQQHPHPQPFAGGPGCQFCGAQPAVQATVRGHQGLLLLMRFLSRGGVFCRSCGLATYREMSAKTLWQGWWSPLSVAITPLTLLMNLGPRGRFRKLAAPVGGFRPPLDPGKSLLRRPEALLFLLPMALVVVAIPALVVFGAFVDGTGIGKAPTLAVGDCVRNEGDWKDEDLEVVDCGSADAEYKVTRRLDTSKDHCAGGDLLAGPEYSPDKATISCLSPAR